MLVGCADTPILWVVIPTIHSFDFSGNPSLPKIQGVLASLCMKGCASAGAFSSIDVSILEDALE